MSGNIEDLSVGLDLEDSGFEGGIRRAEATVSAAMKRIGAMRAEAEIKADISDVEVKEKKAAAILDRWKAKRATATLDVDTKKADSYIKGLETKLANIGKAKSALAVELSERSKRTATELDKIARAADGVRGSSRKANTEIDKTARKVENLGRESKKAEANLVTWAGKISDTTVRLGPFTSSLKGTATALTLLSPLVVGVAGALGSLVSVVGAGIIGAAGLGGAALTGFGLTAVGLYGALKPLGTEIKTITTASKAYATAVDKYGSASKQAATAQRALNSTLEHMSPTARAAFSDLGRMNAEWTKLTAPTRRVALDTLGQGISTLEKLMPSLAARTNQAAKALGTGLSTALRTLRSGNGRTTLDTIFGGFVKTIPSLMAGFRALAGAGGHFIAAFAGGPLKGIAVDFENWAKGVSHAADNTTRMEHIAAETVSAFKAVTGATGAAGRVLFQFFRGGLGAGMGLTDNITTSLNNLAHKMSTVAGQKSLGTFFSNAAGSAKLLWNALTPLLGTFVNFAAIFAPFANAASNIARALGSITQAASGIPGVGTALKAAFGYELLRALPIVGRVLPGIGTSLAKVTRAGERGSIFGGLASGLRGLGPLGIAAGIGLTAAGIGLGHLFKKGDSADQAVRAANDQLQRAILLSHEYHDAQQQSGTAVQRDKLAIDQDRLALAQATKGTLAHRQALVALRGDQLQHTADLKAENTATTEQVKTWKQSAKRDDEAVAQLKTKVQATKDAITAQERLNATGPVGVRGTESGTQIGLNKSLADSKSKLAMQSDRLVTAEERAAAAHINESRALRSLPILTGQYEVALGRLALTSQRVAKAVAIKFSSPAAASSVANAAQHAATMGVPTSQLLKVIADTSGAKQAISGFKALLAGVPDSVVTDIIAHTTGTERVLALRDAAKGVPSSTIAYVIAHATGRAAILALKAAADGVPPSTLAKILATTTGKAELDALNAAIANVHSTAATATLTTVYRTIGSPSGSSAGVAGKIKAAQHATGTGPSAAHRALVGEGGAPEWIVDPAKGSAWKTGGPMMVDLPKSAYVIPTEFQRRGRDLLAGAARDLGVPGYSKGKVGGGMKGVTAPKSLPVPKAYSAGGVSVELASSREAAAHKNYTDREQSIHNTEGKITAARKALVGKKGKPLAAGYRKLHDLESKLSGLHTSEEKLRAHWQQSKADLAALNKINARIARLDTLQSNDRTKMANAAATGNSGAYKAAQTERQGYLSQLSALYERAKKYAPDASQLKATLAGNVADTVSNALEAGVSFASTQTAPSAVSLSDFISGDSALKATLSGLSFNLARDNATPGADTTADQAALNTFYSNLIGSGRLTQDQQTEAYGDISNPAANGGLTDDQQAQLSQLQANGGYLAQAKAINTAYAQAALGQGSIDAGSGGGPSITINTLHPGDPATLRAIGDAATTGMGYQPSRSNPRVNTGL